MALYRKKGDIVEARRLGSPIAEQADTLRWLNVNGYPWLLGDPERPSEMAPKNGNPGDKGIRIDEHFGELVMHTGRISYRAAIGDYLVEYADGRIVPHKAVFFEAQYEEVAE